MIILQPAPFEFLCKYESLIPCIGEQPIMWDLIYAIQSEWISDRLVRLPNCAIKADCCGSNGDSNMELLVVYSAMNARLKSSTLQKFSYYQFHHLYSFYLLTIIHFLLCVQIILFLSVLISSKFFCIFFYNMSNQSCIIANL
jgi:hypothetical protein